MTFYGALERQPARLRASEHAALASIVQEGVPEGVQAWRACRPRERGAAPMCAWLESRARSSSTRWKRRE